ncbi:unnamed protein product [Calypogeia fissa]
MNSPMDNGNQIHRLGKAQDEADRHSLAQQEETELLPPAERDRPWADLGNDALTEVFSRLSLEEKLRTVPIVCKGWRNATLEPACWRNVDMEEWFEKRVQADYWWEFECEPIVERLVMKAVDLSCGQLEELRTRHCTDPALDYIAERCPSLTVLSIPTSLFVTDGSVANLAPSCPKLKVLDVSDCYNISNQALAAVGQNCKSLAWLSRNMVDRDLVRANLDPAKRLTPGSHLPGGDEEAIVVSKHMANLKHLEMMKTSLSNKGLAHLARGCGQLQTLNLACCTDLSPEALDRVSAKCPNIVEFTKPITPRMHVDSNLLRILFG